MKNDALQDVGAYGNFPTMEEIKRDYDLLMDIIKDVRTVEQAREMEKKGFTIEINGVSIDEYVKGMHNEEIEWIRYETFGCLSYIYDRFDGKPMFDVFSNYLFTEFIYDITIDKLTEELYEKAKQKY